MDARKHINLKAALEAAPEPVAPEPKYRQANRIGKINLTAWVDPVYKYRMRLIQLTTNENLQTLMIEALDDFFRKHNVESIREIK